MFERISFYFQHSYSDLTANLFRTIFAIVCIAAGVGAVTTLQNMGVIINETLIGNLQSQNRGDISLRVQENLASDEFEGQEEEVGFGAEFDDEVQRGIDEGALVAYEPFSGLSIAVLTDQVVPMLQEWGAENYGESFATTYNSRGMADDIGVIFGSAPGSFMTNRRNSQNASQQTALFIDHERYPFFSEVLTRDGEPIEDILEDPRNIVISEKTATRLNADVGDRVQLMKMEGDFTVAGIVDDNEEIRDPFGGDIFLGIFGYYYMNIDAISQFGEDIEEVRISTVFIRLDDPEQVEQIADAIEAEFPYLVATTTGDLRDRNEDISDVLSDILKAIGLLALLLGSIGIINTMQVIVRRRTLEVGVLKTLGLKGGQITMLFMVEALLHGLLGSIVGIITGLGLSYVIRNSFRIFVGQELGYTVAVDPILNGIIVGVVVTTVFGFLPTLAAARVRPSVVLRPKDAVAPRSGIIAILFTLVLTILVLAVTVMNVMDLSFLLSSLIVGGVFVGGGFLFVILWLTIWVVARFVPHFGDARVELAKNELRSAKSRSAVTLLALVIGIFSLSSITLFADALSSLIDELLSQSAGGRPVIVQVGDPNDVERVNSIIQKNPDVEDYIRRETYETRILNWIKVDGETVPIDNVEPTMSNQLDDVETQRVVDIAYLQRRFESINAFQLENIEYEDDTVLAGRLLTGEDIETPGIVLRKAEGDLGIHVGDQVTIAFGEDRNAPQVTFTIVGFVPYPDVSVEDEDLDDYVLIDAIPASATPDTAIFNVAMPADDVGSLQRDMQAVESAFVFDTRIISTLIDALIGVFRFFPTLFGIVGLLVGAVVIANSVALSTLERRRDIAVLKAIGLKRFGVLAMIIVESGLMGIVGALLGVGFGVIALAGYDWYEDAIDIDINWEIVAAMTFLSIGIAVTAALLASWHTSGEKPLNVLRYE
ncbi:MAG: ABC transporter permease [Chloroflexi bacterium]|nr:ABC transporter permease [Chloroflexota bacterium]